MKENFIDKQTLKIAIGKGFDKSTLPYRDANTLELVTNAQSRLNYCGGMDVPLKDIEGVANLIKIPTQDQMRSWLWFTHGIWIDITLWGDGIGFTAIIKQAKGKEPDGSTTVMALTTVGSIHCNDPIELIDKSIIQSFVYI